MKKVLTTMLCMLMFTFVTALASASGLTLSWEKPDDNRVTGYNIYVGIKGTDYKSSPIQTINSPDQTNVPITNLEGGQTYEFVATSFDNEGNESNFSDTIEYFVDVVVAPIEYPTKPLDVAIAYDGLDNLVLSWGASEGSVANYNIYMSDTVDVKTNGLIASVIETEHSVIIPGAMIGQTYYFAVEAVTENTNITSPLSDKILYTVEAPSKVIKILGKPRTMILQFD